MHRLYVNTTFNVSHWNIHRLWCLQRSWNQPTGEPRDPWWRTTTAQRETKLCCVTDATSWPVLGTVLLNLLPFCILSPPARILSKLALSTSFHQSLTSFRQNLHWTSNNLLPTPNTDLRTRQTSYVRISLCQWADIHTPTLSLRQCPLKVPGLTQVLCTSCTLAGPKPLSPAPHALTTP